jgi:hypothetical protein
MSYKTIESYPLPSVKEALENPADYCVMHGLLGWSLDGGKGVSVIISQDDAIRVINAQKKDNGVHTESLRNAPIEVRVWVESLDTKVYCETPSQAHKFKEFIKAGITGLNF